MSPRGAGASEGRDALAPLRERLAARLAPEGLTLVDVAPLGGGACQDLFRVDVIKVEDGAPARYVLRSDATRPLPQSIPRAAERQVAAAAAAAGVKTPAPRLACDGVVRDGAGAWLMGWVEGETIGRRVVSHPSLARAREGLVPALARELALLHAVTPATHPHLVAALGPPPVDSARPAGARSSLPPAGLASGHPLRHAVRAVAAMAGESPRPAIAIALRWLEERAAAAPAEPVVLAHGDFRVGNLVVGPGGLAAVLDWEFARWSAPAEDLAWLCVRDWRFGNVALGAGGLAPRAELYRAYAEASGRAVDARAVRVWEVLGGVRWALGCIEQGRRYAARPDLELLAIARRAPEIEWEALRLIERDSRSTGTSSAGREPPGVSTAGAPGSSPPLERDRGPPSPAAPAGAAPPTSGLPSSEQLLAGVARFLDEQVRGALEPGLAYRARIASALLRGAVAERAVASQADAADVARLGALLDEPPLAGAPDEPSRREALEQLERRLSERALAGEVDRGAALALVRDSLRARLAVSAPDLDLRDDVGDDA